MLKIFLRIRYIEGRNDFLQEEEQDDINLINILRVNHHRSIEEKISFFLIRNFFEVGKAVVIEKLCINIRKIYLVYTAKFVWDLI